MKTKSTRNFWGLTLLMLLSSCMQTYRVYDPYRISDLPTPPHSNKVQVYFLGEQPDNNEYVRTHMFEVHSYNGATYASMVRALQDRAEKKNVDALIVLTPESFYDPSVKILTGVGIKFKANVDYLEKYRLVDQLYLYNEEKDDFVQIANLYPDFNHQIFQYEAVDDFKEAGYYYKNYIRKYSVPFLLEDRSSLWSYSHNVTTGFLNRRTYRNRDSQTTITVSPDFEERQLTHLEVTYRMPGKPLERKFIAISYGEEGRIVEKIIKDQQKKPILKEVFIYDERGKYLQSTYYRLENEKEIPFLRTNYFYYENEDIYTYF